MNTDEPRWRKRLVFLSMSICVHLWMNGSAFGAEARFAGKHFVGEGDVEHLRLLEISRRLLEPDPEFQNLSMLYEPKWNGLVEGPNWDAWWIQNSYGPSY